MFPLAKLERLPLKTSLRKIVLIFKDLEMRLLRGEPAHADRDLRRYLEAVVAGAAARSLPPVVCTALHAVADAHAFANAQTLLRALNTARHAVLSYMGAEASEWDFLDAETGRLDAARRRVLPIRVYLEDIRSPYNVGSILRTAEAFGAEKVWLSPSVPLPTHRRARRTARGAEESVSWAVEDLTIAVGSSPVFALETGGISLHEFSFPPSGTVLVGSEELGLSPEALARADASLGRVSIPLGGAKRSLNVAVAFGILMQRWYTAVGGLLPYLDGS